MHWPWAIATQKSGSRLSLSDEMSASTLTANSSCSGEFSVLANPNNIVQCSYAFCTDIAKLSGVVVGQLLSCSAVHTLLSGLAGSRDEYKFKDIYTQKMASLVALSGLSPAPSSLRSLLCDKRLTAYMFIYLLEEPLVALKCKKLQCIRAKRNRSFQAHGSNTLKCLEQSVTGMSVQHRDFLATGGDTYTTYMPGSTAWQVTCKRMILADTIL